VYPSTKNTSTGWTSDYAPLTQVKTKKDSGGAEIAAANPLLVPLYNGPPSKGAMKQNGETRILEISDGTSNTTLYSEAGGRTQQYFTGLVTSPTTPRRSPGRSGPTPTTG